MRKLLGILLVAGVSLASATAFGLGGSLPDFTTLVASNASSVVNISTTQVVQRRNLPKDFGIPDLPEDSPFRDFFKKFFEEMPEQQDTHSLGSGFVISNDGYVLTCAHVIADASEIIVRFSDRRELSAKVVGMDRRSDVALLKVEAADLKAVKIGDPGPLQVGEWVLAIGSPFGFESTATAGIVSAKGRSLPNENYVPFIQTDAAINPGNSGGPLFNLAGEVVGINAQIYSRTGGFMGLSFAVPIDIAMQVADQLKEHGKVKRGWLGVLIQNVTRELAESFGMSKPAGALISEIMPDSPAASADLKPGDIILKYNGKPLDEMADLPPMVGVTPIGDTVTLEIMREGKIQEAQVTIGELPEEGAEVAEAPAPVERGANKLLGMTVEDLTAEQRESLGVEGGIYVSEVEAGPARRAGLQKGDVILQIHGQPVTGVDMFARTVGGLPAGKSVPILIRRENRSLFLALRTDDGKDRTD